MTKSLLAWIAVGGPRKPRISSPRTRRRPARSPKFRSANGGIALGAFLLALLAPLLLVVAPSLWAQVTTSSISGYVYDPSGAPISNAEITVSDARHSFARKMNTDSAGAFRFVGLTPTVYMVSASAEGFVPVKQPEVTLPVETQLRTDFHLSIAGGKETVEVRAERNTIQTESGELGTVLDQHRMDALPLNKRDFLQLALLVPGIFPPVQSSELSTRGSFSMHANGGREEYNNFLLDGADNNDPYVNRYDVEPPVDSIQEFKVATSSYTAEYGRSAAGQINVITRQGTNEFHGSLYEYLRNSVLDARNFFDAPQKPPLIRNQFGFSFGGPVVHGKTYFFAATDFLRGKQGLSRYATVPTLLERGGDLSALCQTGFTNGLCNPAPPGSNLSAVQVRDPAGNAFLGDIIPATSITPLVQNVLKMFPNPNATSGPGNYLGHPVQTDNNSQGSYRVDHRLSPVDDLTFRYSFGIVDSFEPFPEGSNNLNGYGDYVKDHLQNALAQYQRVLNNHVINSLRVAFNRFSRNLLPQNYNVNVGQLWGVNWLNVPPEQHGFPGLNVQGFSGAGDNFGLPILRHANTYQVADNVSWDRGAHVFNLGGEFRELQLNGALDLLTRGTLSFSGFITGSGISDLLLGYPSFTLQSVANNPLTLRSQAYNLYLQDDWRVSSNLTLNLGLRYEYNVPAYDPTNRMSTLDFQTGQVVRLGTNGISRSGIHSDFNNFAPRIGLAWSPVRSFVIRGGYGLYYDSGMFTVNSAQYFNPPEFNLAVYFPSAAGLLTLDNPFPSNAGFTPPPSLSILNPNLRSSYMQQWNLTVERGLGSLGTLSLSYVGSKGTKLIRESDLNQPLPASGDLQSRRRYPQYGNIFFVDSGANSSFNSLQASFNRQVKSHLNLWVAYTYSHSLDNASAFQPTLADPNFPQNSHNLNAEWANSSFDLRHRLVTAAVITLPRGNMWTRNTEFQEILAVQSGQPLTPVLQFDNSNTGNTGGAAGSDRPNIVGNPYSGSCPNPNGGAPFQVGTPNCWFNPAAFQIAPKFNFGNAGRNILRGPGFASFDVSLVRHFNLWEGAKLSCEAQAFNLFNRANFDLPQPYADTPNTFGKISSAKAPRQLQFVMRLRF
jgi:outer membrane receptor protein involved in Fe transport